MGDSPHYFVQLGDEAYMKHLFPGRKKIRPQEAEAYAGLPCASVQDSDTSPPTWALYFNGALVGKIPSTTLCWQDVLTGSGIDEKARSTSFSVLYFTTVTRKTVV